MTNKHIITLQEDSDKVYAAAKADQLRKQKEWLKTPEGKAAVKKRDEENKRLEAEHAKLEKTIINRITDANKEFFKKYPYGLTLKYGEVLDPAEAEPVKLYNFTVHMPQLKGIVKSYYFRSIFNASPKKMERYFKGDWKKFYAMVKKYRGIDPKKWKFTVIEDEKMAWRVHVDFK